MKIKIENYLDSLFDDIHETKQVRELKEEMAANLLDKINDFIANGDNKEKAFKKGVASLGNVDELINNLRTASQAKVERNLLKPKPLNKKHVMGYMTATVVLLLGFVVAGIVYLLSNNVIYGVATFVSFAVVSSALYVYYGLTQETAFNYGMKAPRALAYSVASAATLAGIFMPLLLYLNGNRLVAVFTVLLLLIIPSIIAFIYLGLTEKSREKITAVSGYQQLNPQSVKVKDTLSGAIWIFATAIFLIGIFVRWQYWKYSWIVFLFAAGFQVVLEAFFQSRRR